MAVAAVGTPKITLRLRWLSSASGMMLFEALLRRQFNAVKRERFPWALEVSKCAPQYAIKELGRAFANHFKNPGRFGWPKFKKKVVNDSFSISNDQFKVEGSRIRIPNPGWVRMC